MAVRALFPSYKSTEEALRQIVERVNAVIQGRSNAVGTFTCTVSQATTTVTDSRVATDSTITMTATHANSAAEVGNGTIYISTVSNGSFVVTHANSATTDRDFMYSIQG